MSLTHPFGNCENHNVSRIKLLTPSKTEFYSANEDICFDSKKVALVPYLFNEATKATLSGIAFDYLARFLIAQKAKQYRNFALSNLIAEHIYLYNSRKWFQQNDAREMGRNQYNTYLKIIAEFIDGGALLEKDEIVKICVLFAKMEKESRGGKEIAPKFEITTDDEDVVQDVKSLAQVFSDVFLPRVRPDSVIVFNPTFGIGSQVVGGADADVFIDGTLYDFKVRKENSWSSKLARQLVGYYVIDSIAKDAEDITSGLWGHQIERVALYNARFAETVFYDTDRIDPTRFSLIKNEIRHEYLMRRLYGYKSDILSQLEIPLTKDELRYCSDDTELDIEVWGEIDKTKANEIRNAWNALNDFLKNTDTKVLLRNIVALHDVKNPLGTL